MIPTKEASLIKGQLTTRRKWALAILAAGTLVLIGLCAFAYISFREWALCPHNVAICVRLNVNGQPTVGNVVKANVEVVSRDSISPNTTLTITLSPQIELVEGNLKWHGDLAADERIKQTITIRVTQPGEWVISAYAFSDFGRGYGHGDSDGVFVLSSTRSAEISRERSPNNWYPSTRFSGDGAFIGPALPGATSLKTDHRFKTSITLLGQPNLNESITIIYALTTTIPITNANVNLIYPLKGFELTEVQFSAGSDETRRDNPLVWRGNLESDQSVTIIATFKITEVGRGPIVGFLGYIEPRGNLSYGVIETAGREINLEVNKYAGSFQIATPEPP